MNSLQLFFFCYYYHLSKSAFTLCLFVKNVLIEHVFLSFKFYCFQLHNFWLVFRYLYHDINFANKLFICSQKESTKSFCCIRYKFCCAKQFLKCFLALFFWYFISGDLFKFAVGLFHEICIVLCSSMRNTDSKFCTFKKCFMCWSFDVLDRKNSILGGTKNFGSLKKKKENYKSKLCT